MMITIIIIIIINKKPKELEGMKKGKHNKIRIRCLEKTQKILQKPGHEEYRGQGISLYGRSRDLLEVAMGRRSTAY